MQHRHIPRQSHVVFQHETVSSPPADITQHCRVESILRAQSVGSSQCSTRRVHAGMHARMPGMLSSAKRVNVSHDDPRNSLNSWQLERAPRVQHRRGNSLANTRRATASSAPSPLPWPRAIALPAQLSPSVSLQ
eukprot:2656083-Rhodomonas_salina.2